MPLERADVARATNAADDASTRRRRARGTPTTRDDASKRRAKDLDALDASMPTPRVALSAAPPSSRRRDDAREAASEAATGGATAASSRFGLGWVVFHARAAAAL